MHFLGGGRGMDGFSLVWVTRAVSGVPQSVM